MKTFLRFLTAAMLAISACHPLQAVVFPPPSSVAVTVGPDGVLLNPGLGSYSPMMGGYATYSLSSTTYSIVDLTKGSVLFPAGIGVGSVTGFTAVGPAQGGPLFTLVSSNTTSSILLTATLNKVGSNTVFAGAVGAGPTDYPAFRSLVDADLPVDALGPYLLSGGGGTLSGTTVLSGNFTLGSTGVIGGTGTLDLSTMTVLGLSPLLSGYAPLAGGGTFTGSTAMNGTLNGTGTISALNLSITAGPFARVFNVMHYGASGVGITTTGTVSSGSPTVALANSVSLSAGQGIFLLGAGGAQRSVSDGVTTTGSYTVSSATINFKADDVGKEIIGAGIPVNTTVAAVSISGTIDHALVSTSASTAQTGVTFIIGTGANTRTVSDGITSTNSYTVTSATANFTYADAILVKTISTSAGISWSTSLGGTITSVPILNYSTTASLSAAATANGSGITFTLLKDLVATVSTISGTTATISPAASYTLAGGLVMHDDTVAINAAIAAATTNSNLLSNYTGGYVYFPVTDTATQEGIYRVNGPFNGTTNSLLTFPQLAWNYPEPVVMLIGEMRGLTLADKAISQSGSFSSPASGALITSTNHPVATNSYSSIIAPHAYSATTSFAGIGVGVDNLFFLTESNPTISGLNFHNILQSQNGNNYDVMAVGGGATSVAQPTTSTSVGLRLPLFYNDLLVEAGQPVISGFYTGATTAENAHFNGGFIIACIQGIYFEGGQGAVIGHARVADCTYPIVGPVASTMPLELEVTVASAVPGNWWSIVGAEIYDPANLFRGILNIDAVQDNGVAHAPYIVGATGVNVVDLGSTASFAIVNGLKVTSANNPNAIISLTAGNTGGAAPSLISGTGANGGWVATDQGVGKFTVSNSGTSTLSIYSGTTSSGSIMGALVLGDNSGAPGALIASILTTTFASGTGIDLSFQTSYLGGNTERLRINAETGNSTFSNALNVNGALTGASLTGGALTATAGATITSTATSSAAAAGIVGQYVASTISPSGGIQLASANTATRATSISLPPGDWDVTAVGTFVAGLATVTQSVVGVSTVSNSTPTTGLESYGADFLTVGTGTFSVPVVEQQFSLSTTTSIYLVGKAGYSAGTMSFSGTIIGRLRR